MAHRLTEKQLVSINQGGRSLRYITVQGRYWRRIFDDLLYWHTKKKNVMFVVTQGESLGSPRGLID
jgi:hypothetical protein